MPVEDDYLVYNYNRFQASRFGLDGVITHPKTYEQIPLREDIIATSAVNRPSGPKPRGGPWIPMPLPVNPRRAWAGVG